MLLVNIYFMPLTDKRELFAVFNCCFQIVLRWFAPYILLL